MTSTHCRPLIAGAIKFALALIAATTVLCSCSTPTPGAAIPTANNPATAAPTDSDPFNGLRQCPTLDQVLEGQGFPPAQPMAADIEHACNTVKTDFGAVALWLDPSQGIDHIHEDPSKITDGNINGRPSAQVRDLLGVPRGCAIAMEVTKTARAYIVITGGSDTDQACSFVYELAKKIEPMLPKPR